jgi:hypothetical protein
MASFFATADKSPHWSGARSCDFRKSKAAWKFFQAQPPGYRQQVIWRIVSAKRAQTRERRLADLIKASQERRRL